MSRVKRNFGSSNIGTNDGGFSLVEVIIAIGVLAGVLLSIASMFMLGGRQVKAGKPLGQDQFLFGNFDRSAFVPFFQRDPPDRLFGYHIQI